MIVGSGIYALHREAVRRRNLTAEANAGSLTVLADRRRPRWQSGIRPSFN